MKKYGLTDAAFSAMLLATNSACSICRTPFDIGSTKANGLTVDHNHTTGAVRGLLCHLCNRGIGCFRDSPENISAALAYLNEQPNT